LSGLADAELAVVPGAAPSGLVAVLAALCAVLSAASDATALTVPGISWFATFVGRLTVVPLAAGMFPAFGTSEPVSGTHPPWARTSPATTRWIVAVTRLNCIVRPRSMMVQRARLEPDTPAWTPRLHLSAEYAGKAADC
jgi:hypothetical protein